MNLLYNSIDEMPNHLKIIPISFLILVIILIIVLIFSFFHWVFSPSKTQKKIMWTNKAIYNEHKKQNQLLQKHLQETSNATIVDQLQKLAYLKENNHINNDEYDYLKMEILNSKQ